MAKSKVTQEDLDAAADEKSEFDETLKAAGADGEYWAKLLIELSKAKEIKAQIPKGKNEFVYSKLMPALDIRVRVQDIAHRLRGDYKAEKREHMGSLTLEEIIKSQDKEEGK